jgi:hypothetical protein
MVLISWALFGTDFPPGSYALNELNQWLSSIVLIYYIFGKIFNQEDIQGDIQGEL